MPTTPILGLPYPAATDPADVPTDMGELANRVEAVRGLTNGLASLDATGKVPLTQLTPIAYGTTLPGSPVDGQEAILVDSLTNPSYQWRFRYNAGSTSPYKWEYVGGTPFLVSGGNWQATLTANTWTDFVTGPTFTLPRAGDYSVNWSIRTQNWGVSAPAYDSFARIFIGLGSGSETSITFPNNTASMGAMVTIFERFSGLAAAAAGKVQVQTNAAVLTGWGPASLAIIPMRLS